MQFPIAEAFIEVEAANLMRLEAARRYDAMQPCGAQANMAKHLAAKASWEAANVCLQTHGGFGFASEYDVERKFRETRLYQVAPISTNMIATPTWPSTCSACRGAIDDDDGGARPAPLDGITVVTPRARDRRAVLHAAARRSGARVIKVERPGSGDFARGYDERVKGLASHFVTNRSKESLTLDVKHPRRSRSWRSCCSARRRAGAEPRAGRGGAAGHCRSRRCTPAIGADRLRHLGLWRRSSDGPVPRQEGLRPADPERVGLPVGHRLADAPAKAGCSIADIAAGMYAYTASSRHCSSAAAPARAAASTCRCSRAWSSGWLPAVLRLRRRSAPPRAGAAHATIYPYGPFPAGDGGTVMLGLQNERAWAAFCTVVLRRPELATDERFASNSRRVANSAALRALIDEVFGQLTAEQLIARLDEAQIANAHERHARGLAAPAAAGRAGAGPRSAARPARSPAAAARRHRRVRAVHEPGAGAGRAHRCHPRWLGWSAERIERLRRDGAI